jgi:hypothetical protein
MAKCDTCTKLIAREDGRYIKCAYHGKTHQRHEDCTKYICKSIKRTDLISWAEQ